MESSGVSTVKSERDDIVAGSSLLEVENPLDFFLKFVGYKIVSDGRLSSIAQISYWCTWSEKQPRLGVRQSKEDRHGGSWLQ